MVEAAGNGGLGAKIRGFLAVRHQNAARLLFVSRRAFGPYRLLGRDGADYGGGLSGKIGLSPVLQIFRCAVLRHASRSLSAGSQSESKDDEWNSAQGLSPAKIKNHQGTALVAGG